MINTRDLYTAHVVHPLTFTPLNSKESKTIGTTIISYEIRRYRDLRNLDDTLAYRVLCTQRVVIPNSVPYKPGQINIGGSSGSGGDTAAAFSNYPAIVTNQISLSGSPELVGYSPRTLNSAIMTSSSNGSGTSGSTTMQHTSGSSTAQSNSFGASASIGFFGEALTGGVSVDYDHTSESEKSHSVSAGSDNSSSKQRSGSDSMSVKDWACNAYLDSGTSSPTWVWGQEYPWNVLEYRNDLGTDNVALPGFVSDLLYDASSGQVLPPSALSQFGVDFTMSAAWTVKPAAGDGTTTLTHTIGYYTATHQLPSSAGSNPVVNGQINWAGPMNQPPTPKGGTKPKAVAVPFSWTCPLNLFAYGLDPIQNGGASSAAVVGFIPRRFLVLPAPAKPSGITVTNPTQFVMLSAANNLLVQDTTSYGTLSASDTGAGFTPSETALTAAFTANCASLTMTLSFKVIDPVRGYRLYMKHWMTGTVGVVLTLVINGDTANPIVKYVDALEAEGGENNLLSISLRNLDYGSVDYHDYLQLGLNTIEITLTPIGGTTAGCGYQVRAISIEAE
jgi:hypothetical protein